MEGNCRALAPEPVVSHIQISLEMPLCRGVGVDQTVHTIIGFALPQALCDITWRVCFVCRLTQVFGTQQLTRRQAWVACIPTCNC